VLDLDAWREPVSVVIPDDDLSFVLIPPEVESAAILQLCRELNNYQTDCDPGSVIESALMVTMGGLGPGVLIYDHLVKGRPPALPVIEFGTLGVSFYRDMDERFDRPRVSMPATIDVADKTVLVIDDLGDTGGTLKFVGEYLQGVGARRALNMVLYMKPKAKLVCSADFYFGEVAQETWIITSREQVETLVQRVPVWRRRGASESECRRRLVELIGYPTHLVDHYLPRVYQQAELS